MSIKGIKVNGPLLAVLWSFLQRGGTLIIGFVVNIVLARILCPEDFGIVGFIAVFVGLADILVDSGLGSALIQKKEVTEKHIKTVFTSNLLISIVLFVILFIVAPFIADYVNVPKLDLYLRVESVMVLIRAFYVVQSSLLNRSLKFKDLAGINITASILSAVSAISLALLGCGVWSLIAKNVILHLSLCVLYRIKSRVPYRLGIDRASLKGLFGFGIFVALTNFLDILYSNIVSFILGKKYSVEELGYYNQAYSLKQIPVYSMSMVITQVLFPYLSRMQDDRGRFFENTRKVIRITSFIVFPLITYLVIAAKPIIVFLYSAKWAPSSVYFQILCIAGAMDAFIHINRNILKSLGYTKLIFILQCIITVIGIVLLAISIHFGIKAFIWSVVVFTFVDWILGSSLSGIKSGYSIFYQIRDMMDSLLIAVLCGVVVFYIFGHFNIPVLLLCFLEAVLYLVFYMGLHALLKTQSFLNFRMTIFSK